MFNHNNIRNWYWRRNGMRPNYEKYNREDETRFNSEYARQLEEKIIKLTKLFPEIIHEFEKENG